MDDNDDMYNDTKASSAGYKSRDIPKLTAADEARKRQFQQSVADGTAEIRTAHNRLTADKQLPQNASSFSQSTPGPDISYNYSTMSSGSNNNENMYNETKASSAGFGAQVVLNSAAADKA